MEHSGERLTWGCDREQNFRHGILLQSQKRTSVKRHHKYITTLPLLSASRYGSDSSVSSSAFPVMCPLQGSLPSFTKVYYLNVETNRHRVSLSHSSQPVLLDSLGEKLLENGNVLTVPPISALLQSFRGRTRHDDQKGTIGS